MGWTDERVDQLKSLWTEGLSASQIARVLGGVTRNAVIGKVHRLGLAGRAMPTRTDRPRVPSAPRAMRVHVPEPPVVEEDPLTLADGNFATVLTINDRMCPKNGSPYCEAHARKAYQPQQPRREKTRMVG
jgi:GcrA cell cycle regulator